MRNRDTRDNTQKARMSSQNELRWELSECLLAAIRLLTDLFFFCCLLPVQPFFRSSVVCRSVFSVGVGLLLRTASSLVHFGTYKAVLSCPFVSFLSFPILATLGAAPWLIVHGFLALFLFSLSLSLSPVSASKQASSHWLPELTTTTAITSNILPPPPLTVCVMVHIVVSSSSGSRSKLLSAPYSFVWFGFDCCCCCWLPFCFTHS